MTREEGDDPAVAGRGLRDSPQSRGPADNSKRKRIVYKKAREERSEEGSGERRRR